MATINDPEATQILTQLNQVQDELANRAKASDFNSTLTGIRDDITTEQSEIAALITRINNAHATLNDLESRVQALESA